MKYCQTKCCHTVVVEHQTYCIDHKCLICPNKREYLHIYCEHHICKNKFTCYNNTLFEHNIDDLSIIWNNLPDKYKYDFTIDDFMDYIYNEIEFEIDIFNMIMEIYDSKHKSMCVKHLIITIKKILTNNIQNV